MIRRINVTIALSALFVFLMSGSAYAYKMGDVDVTVDAQIGETYDDNITYEKDDKKSDFITALTAGIAGKYEGRRVTIDVSGDVTEQLYAEHSNFNNTSETASAVCLYEISKYDRINLKDTFSHTYEPRSFEEEFGVNRGHYSYFRNKFYIDYTRDISKQLSAIVRYTNSLDVPSIEDISDSYLNSAGVELDYLVSSQTIVLGSYDFSIRKFDPGNDAKTHAAAFGLRQYITKQFYFDGRVGLDYLNSYNGQNYTKPMFMASLTDDLDKNTSIAVSFTKQYQTNAYSQDLFNYWEISGSFKRQLTKRLRFAGSVFYGNGEYMSGDISDDLFGGKAAFFYDMTEHLSAELSYRYSMTDSNASYREYKKNTVFLGMTAEF